MEERALNINRDFKVIFKRKSSYPAALWVFHCNSRCRTSACRHIARAEKDGLGGLNINMLDYELLPESEPVQIVGQR